MKDKRILYVSSEWLYLAENEVSLMSYDVHRRWLMIKVARLRYMPGYGNINERKKTSIEVN
jgi:starch synthase